MVLYSHAVTIHRPKKIVNLMAFSNPPACFYTKPWFPYPLLTIYWEIAWTTIVVLPQFTKIQIIMCKIEKVARHIDKWTKYYCDSTCNLLFVNWYLLSKFVANHSGISTRESRVPDLILTRTPAVVLWLLREYQWNNQFPGRRSIDFVAHFEQGIGTTPNQYSTDVY